MICYFRWPKGIVPPSINEEKYVSEYNEFYRESFEGGKSEPEQAKAEVPLSGTKIQERVRNKNLDYFPGNDLNVYCRIKVWCVFPMDVVSLLTQAEFGTNDHRKDASL